MSSNRTSSLLAALVAIILVVAGVLLATRITRGDSSLLRNAIVDKTAISPNADGSDDATEISYEITRDAIVSIYFEAADGTRHYFRESKTRGANDYRVQFSGIVDGYLLPDEAPINEIESRLLQNGAYRWVIEATEITRVDDDGNVTETGATEIADGQLTVSDGDAVLPFIAGFEMDRREFTPNRDGIGDRLKIQFDLKKDAEVLRVYLRTPDGSELEVQALPGARPARSVSDAPFVAGRHVYDYEGGVDLNATPPPDGTYDIVIFAQDAEGQKVRIQDQLTMELGGVPLGEIPAPLTGPAIQFTLESEDDGAWIYCDTLFVQATVRNYGDVPLRTTGPEPGLVYDSDWNYNTVGWGSESGAFRFAVGYEDEQRNYAYRWAAGSRDELTKIGDHYYLMPGQQVIVTGGIRLTHKLGERLHQPIWAGLIHEDVAISQLNDRVGRTGINIVYPDVEEWPACDAREVPVREK